MPVLLFRDSNEKEEVTPNFFPKINARICPRDIVATHLPPANPGWPPMIIANFRQRRSSLDIMYR
ncbi:protein of unknown function [Paenibacillus alvei]|uniref:Uncharacterized protein n=1 Tax=Paenibacillus alvei TaxID=44250 RepID=A0A383R9T8_PAEAL|nr:protein of unknown function [Paenibacillus alvei]